jgi:Tol biopolymer transport system component
MCTLAQRLLPLASLAFLPVLGACSSTPNGDAAAGAATGTLYVNGDTHTSIYAVDLASGAATKIAAGADPYPTPDGTILCKSSHTSALGEYSADGTTFRTIVSQNDQAPFDQTYDDDFHNPQLSPDGKYVAYEGQLGYTFDIYVVDRAT